MNFKTIIRDFIGTHGQTQLSCQINGKVIPGQGWQAKLTQVAVDRLNLDRDLLEALPAGVRKNITNLNISGPIHYHGSLDLNYNANLPIPISGQWDGELGLHEVSISKGITLRGICGGVTTKGYFSDNFFYSQGELAIDSLLWDSIQFARIKGPYQINNDQLYLGTGANDLVKRIFPNDKNTFSEPMNYGKPYSVSARIFGGDIAADIAILMGENPRFGIFTEMRNVRLEQCGEVTQSEKLRGKIDMLVNIWGTAGDMNSLSGLGDLRLSEADIYQLPAMVSMLKLLSIREPNTNAFSNSEAVFRIVGPHLFFDKINFRGDAISLYGNGEMDFNRRVNMSFYPLVGKGEVEIPIINALFRGVSKNTMMIRMDGTLSDLKIWRESPLVNDFRGVENGLFSQ